MYKSYVDSQDTIMNICSEAWDYSAVCFSSDFPRIVSKYLIYDTLERTRL